MRATRLFAAALVAALLLPAAAFAQSEPGSAEAPAVHHPATHHAKHHAKHHARHHAKHVAHHRVAPKPANG